MAGVIKTNSHEDDATSVAISWFLHNACRSNVELAAISNVCRGWRHVSSRTIASEAVAMAADNPSDANEPQSIIQFSYIRKMLLTEMAREMITRQRKRGSAGGVVATPSSTPRSESSSATDANFCLAWFAPSGIQTISVPLDGKVSNGDVEDDDIPQRQQNGKRQRGRKAASGRSVTCCPEWRGYRHATEVLAPFGYSTDFIITVLDASSESARCAVGTTSSLASAKKSKALLSYQYNPNFCVRGSTLARPEGFCLCTDEEYITHADSSDFEKPAHAANHRVPSRIDEWMQDRVDGKRPPKSNVGLSAAQRKQKRGVLARELLLRMVLSTRRKYPLLHRFAEEAAGDGRAGEGRPPLPWERRQRAVQFLNSDKSQAVKLITPKFDCGPVRGPVTMFVVAITTEDGCFLSGRSSRFELGHMYPLCPRDMQFDMSPICIATGKKEEAGDGGGESGAAEDCAKRDVRSSSVGKDDGDESAVHCLCKFDSGNPYNPKELSIGDPTEECVHRGCVGPGLWHCYVALFDGKDSEIRVDGEREPQRTRDEYGLPEVSDGDDPDHVANASRRVGSGALDGLSIGSDHQFDMSLCYGDIDGECGQGAIAELAVFKGRMDEADIERLESYLMSKHGILPVKERLKFVADENSARMKPIYTDCHLEEDEWRRQAHGLIEQNRPWDLRGIPVPLRVAANHHSVAWDRTNVITGLPIRVSRIGAKRSNGSSDW